MIGTSADATQEIPKISQEQDDDREYPAMETKVFNSDDLEVHGFSSKYGRGAVLIDGALKKNGGERTEQQDCVVVIKQDDTERFWVIDGMGGEGDPHAGRMAADILAGSALKGGDIGEIQQTAHSDMKAKGLGRGGACFLVFEVKDLGERKILRTYQAGDVHAVVINMKESVITETEDESETFQLGSLIYSKVTNAVTGETAGEISEDTLFLPPGKCRIVCASDGLWRYFKSSEKALTAIRSVEDPIEAVKILRAVIKSYGDVDNISIVIYDVDHE